MIIDNLHIVAIPFSPFKTFTPLVVDADAVLARTVVGEFFQAICGGDAKVLQRHSPIEHP